MSHKQFKQVISDESVPLGVRELLFKLQQEVDLGFLYDDQGMHDDYFMFGIIVFYPSGTSKTIQYAYNRTKKQHFLLEEIMKKVPKPLKDKQIIDKWKLVEAEFNQLS